MGAEDSVAIVGGNVKAFKTTNDDGTVVEIQAIVLVDSDGNPIQPISEATGLQLLAALRAIDEKLARLTNTLPANI